MIAPLELDGAVYTREWPGSGTHTFVCLHAVGGSHVHWLGVAPKLAERGRVLAPDLAGFGLTPARQQGASLDAQVALVSALLDRTGPGILVGSSLGGAIGLLQAAQSPESVTGLILTGSLLPPYRDGSPPAPDFSL